jgi:uncharacterized protein
MRRMPADLRLSTLVHAAAPVDSPVRQVARTLAAAHASAPRSALINAQGSVESLFRRWQDSLSQAAASAGRLLDPDAHTEIDGLVRQFLAGREPLLRDRIDGGRIVAGHGDLLADHIYCLDDGPRILDCLDVDDRRRWLDGLDDAACLVMDLERLGARDLGRRFADWYGEFAADPAPASLLHHYVAYRGFVRAKIACMEASEGPVAARRDAKQLADLALRHLRAGVVTLVLIGGLPGTGKTTLAESVGASLGWAVLSSDRVRKEIAGLPPHADGRSAFGTGIYTSEWTARTYGELLRRAGELLAHGESAILDASWTSGELRSAATRVARAHHAHLIEVLCTAAAEVADRRLLTRPRGASDAGPQVPAKLAAAAAPWPTAIVIDTGRRAAGAAADEALAAIRPHGSEHVWRRARPIRSPD